MVSTALAPRSDNLLESAVGYTRQEMARRHVSVESWYTAFRQEEDRQQMRDTGRRLFGLAIQHLGRQPEREPVFQEARRIGRFYGERCAEQGISLVDTVRALFFFRESLLRSAVHDEGGQGADLGGNRPVRDDLRHFMNEVTYACLASYEATCRQLPPPQSI
jgi:hypothetical protein